MDILEFYASQSPFTDPGTKARMIEGVPTDIDGIMEVIRTSCLTYHDRHKYPIQNERLIETNFRKVEDMLGTFLYLDRRAKSIAVPRPAEARLMCAQSHFATLFVSLARNAGIPARKRVGFARMEDVYHVYEIAEYYENGEWKQADTSGEGYDFIPAGQAFLDYRTGRVSADKFVDYEKQGAELAVDCLILDLASCNKYEMTTWDRYGWMLRPISDYSERAWTILADVADVLLNKDKDLDAIIACYNSEEGIQVPARVYIDSPLLPPHNAVIAESF